MNFQEGAMLRRAFLSVVASIASVGLLRVRPAAGDDPLRGTGRTTACILEAFANALRHPDEWVLFSDHEPMTEDRAASLAPYMARQARECGLKLDVIQDGACILVRSPIEAIRNGTYQPQPAPPRGVIPAWLWVEHRVQDLRGALERADDKDPMRIRHWAAELFHLVEWLQEYKPDSPEIRGVACVDARVGRIIDDYGIDFADASHNRLKRRYHTRNYIARKQIEDQRRIEGMLMSRRVADGRS